MKFFLWIAATAGVLAVNWSSQTAQQLETWNHNNRDYQFALRRMIWIMIVEMALIAVLAFT